MSDINVDTITVNGKTIIHRSQKLNNTMEILKLLYSKEVG